MSESIEFDKTHFYNTLETGITVVVKLFSEDKFVEFRAKIDTGASFCIFERTHGERMENKINLPRKGNFKLNLSLSLLNEDAYKAFMEKVNTDENYAIYKQADITYGTST